MVILARLLAESGRLELGQLTVGRNERGIVVRGPAGGPVTSLACDADAVRLHVAEDSDGKYRPLPGARTLRPGWEVACTSDRAAEEVVDAVYPLALAHLSQSRGGTLAVVALDAVLSRQTGRYAACAKLSDGGRQAASSALCGRCVKQPLWRDGAAPPAGPAWNPPIPCPEPCSVLVSLCREAALWEAAMPSRTAVDDSLAFAAFEAPGNAIREDCLARLEEPARG